MPSENSTIIKIMTKKDKDYNKLSDKYVKLGEKHKTLMEVHAKIIKALDNLTGYYEEQRLEIVEDLKHLRKSNFNDPVIYNYLDGLIKRWEGKK